MIQYCLLQVKGTPTIVRNFPRLNKLNTNTLYMAKQITVPTLYMASKLGNEIILKNQIMYLKENMKMIPMDS